MDKDTDDLIEEFVAVGGDFRDWRPGWNIRPTDPVVTIFEHAGARRIELARWALTPGWSPTLKTKMPHFNARSEGITEKPTFKTAVKSKRALIPATGYYEWQTDPVSKKKTPYFIQPTDGLMMFAGLYSWWHDKTLPDDDPAAWALTTTILTADSVHTLEHIHDRNPVPLPPSWWADWLNPTIEGDQSFVDAAVQAAIPVADALEIVQIVAVTDERPVPAPDARFHQ